MYHHRRICKDWAYLQSIQFVRGLGQRRTPQLKFHVREDLVTDILMWFYFSWTLRMSEVKSESDPDFIKGRGPQ